MEEPTNRGKHFRANSTYIPSSNTYVSASRRVGRATSGQVSAQQVRAKALSTILIVVGVLMFVVAGGIFIHTELEYRKQNEINNSLAAYATVSDASEMSELKPPQVDWAGLKAINSDVVGWVQIPGTKVNFPVYQGKTNNTYLRTSATGEYSIGGQVFLDAENTAPGLVDTQSLIYGHHLNNGEMFAQVDDMAKQENFNKVPFVWYVTETATYKLKPLLFYRTPATDSNARRMTFTSEDEFHAYLHDLLAKSASSSSDADNMINSANKVLTLGTCDYENDFGKGNGRGLLVCTLISE